MPSAILDKQHRDSDVLWVFQRNNDDVTSRHEYLTQKVALSLYVPYVLRKCLLKALLVVRSWSIIDGRPASAVSSKASVLAMSVTALCRLSLGIQT